MAEISVVVPVYNAECHLRRCMDSVLGQTFADIEILCIDDCSSDSSRAIIEEYATADKRVKASANPKNSGSTATRMRGIGQAASEWLAFCDADDWMEHDALRQMLDAARSDGADCVCCGIYRDKPGGRSVVRHADLSGPSDTYNCLYSKLFRRTLFDSLVIDDSIALGDDLMMTAQALHKARHITALDKPLYHYCENLSSITHVENGRKRVEDLAKVNALLRSRLTETCYDAFHDRVTRDALLLWIRFHLLDRRLWRELRSRMKSGLLEDPRHGFAKKGALALAGCIFD